MVAHLHGHMERCLAFRRHRSVTANMCCPTRLAHGGAGAPNPDTMTTHRKRLGRDNALGYHDCFFFWICKLMMSKRSSFDETQHLALGDMATNDQQHLTTVQITLESSMTDPFRKGVDMVLGATGNKLCPVKALFDYLWVWVEFQALF